MNNEDCIICGMPSSDVDVCTTPENITVCRKCYPAWDKFGVKDKQEKKKKGKRDTHISSKPKKIQNKIISFIKHHPEGVTTKDMEKEFNMERDRIAVKLSPCNCNYEKKGIKRVKIKKKGIKGYIYYPLETQEPSLKSYIGNRIEFIINQHPKGITIREISDELQIVQSTIRICLSNPKYLTERNIKKVKEDLTGPNYRGACKIRYRYFPTRNKKQEDEKIPIKESISNGKTKIESTKKGETIELKIFKKKEVIGLDYPILECEGCMELLLSDSDIMLNHLVEHYETQKKAIGILNNQSSKLNHENIQLLKQNTDLYTKNSELSKKLDSSEKYITDFKRDIKHIIRDTCSGIGQVTVDSKETVPLLSYILKKQENIIESMKEYHKKREKLYKDRNQARATELEDIRREKTKKERSGIIDSIRRAGIVK